MAGGGGGHKKDFSIVLILQEQFCTSELFKVIQDAVLLILHLQDNVIIPDGFFKYIYHVGCAINLHSIINSGLIPGGQILSNRQTVFFLLVDPMDEENKDSDTIDRRPESTASCTIHAQSMEETSKRMVYWADINLALKKGLKFYQTRSNAIILQGILPAYCIPEVVRMEIGEVMYEKVYASPRPPPKVSRKHDWMKDLGSEVARQPEGEVARQAKRSQSSQPNPNPDHDRTGNPLFALKEERPVLRNRNTFFS